MLRITNKEFSISWWFLQGDVWLECMIRSDLLITIYSRFDFEQGLTLLLLFALGSDLVVLISL